MSSEVSPLPTAAPPPGAMSFLHVLKKSSRLTVINSAGVALNFVVASYVANLFGPNIYGRISFVLLCVSYAGLVRPGFFEGGQRQTIDLLGRGRPDLARKIQNTGFTSDLIWSIVPAAALGAAAHQIPDPIRHTGFLLAPFLFLAQAVTRMLGGLFLAHQEMGIYTFGYVLRAALQPALLLILARAIGPQSLILAPTVVECVIAGYCVKHYAKIGISLNVDRSRAAELLKIGLPLSLAAVAYWAYRLAGPTCIAAFLTASALGVYTFASKIIDQAVRFFGDFSNVLMPGFWRSLSHAGSASAILADISRVTVYLVLLSCFACNLIQAIAGSAIAAFLPQFISSVPILEILAFNTVLLTISMPVGLLLDSAVVNRQSVHVGIWAAGSILNYAVNYAVLLKGYGVTAIAWNDIWVQVVVVVILYGAAHKALFANKRNAAMFYNRLLAILVYCVGIFFALRIPAWSEGFDIHRLSFLTARAFFVIIVWLPLGLYFRKGHTSSVVFEANAV